MDAPGASGYRAHHRADEEVDKKWKTWADAMCMLFLFTYTLRIEASD